MAYLTIAALSGALFAIAYYLVSFQRYKNLARENGCKPPKNYPHKDPILGLDLLLQAPKIYKEHRFFEIWTQRYRELGSTFESKFWGTPKICSCEPANIQAVLGTNAKDWGVSYRFEVLKQWCGKGVLTTDGAEWEHSRMLLNPIFNKASISDHTDFEHYLKLMLKHIPRDGSIVDLQPLFFSLYLDTATLFLFGESFESLSGNQPTEAEEFIHAAAYSLGGGGLRAALGPLRFLYRNSKWDEANKTNHRIIDGYVDKALARQKRAAEEEKQGLLDDKRQRRPVLIDSLAKQLDDRIELRYQAIHAFAAAHETTACLISNMFFLLARHPSVWQRLRKEALSLGDGPFDYEACMKLKYLRNVINETLRFHPVLPSLIRNALTNTILPTGGGPDGTSPIYVRAGTLFDANFAVLHRRQSIWGPDADEFIPDRWDAFKPQAWQFVPFGGGQRACPGRQKALMETSYLTVRLLREFKGIEARDEREWVGEVKITAKNLNGCRVALIPA